MILDAIVADLEALDEDIRRVGSDRSRRIWGRLRPAIDALVRIVRLYEPREAGR